MLRKSLRHACVTLLALLMIIGFAFAKEGEKPSNQGGGQMDESKMQEMMDLWIKYSTPGEQHQKLKDLSGKWKSETKMKMGPNAGEQVSESECDYSMVLGGRFLKFQYTGKMMGMDYEGIGFLGYDNFRQRYNLFWIDNTVTGITVAYGDGKDDDETVTLMGKMDEPATGEKDKDVKYVFHFLNNEHHTFEIWDMLPGHEFIAIEMNYTRIK